jgi:hypothetical protein
MIKFSSKKGSKKLAKLKKELTFAPALEKFIKILEALQKVLTGKQKVYIFAVRLFKKGKQNQK